LPARGKKGAGESNIPISPVSATQTHQAWSRLQQAYAESKTAEKRGRHARFLRIFSLLSIGGLFLAGIFLYVFEPLGTSNKPTPLPTPLPTPVGTPPPGTTNDEPAKPAATPQPTIVVLEPVQFDVKNGVPVTRGVPDPSQRTIGIGASSPATRAGAESATRQAQPPRRGNLHVVIVDVEKLLYKKDLFQTVQLDEVAGAEADGEDFQLVFSEMASLPPNHHYPYDFNKDSISRFTTAGAGYPLPTRDRVRDHIQMLADNLQENDLFLFYFAGHGYTDAENDQYLVMYDTLINKERYTERALPYSQIEEIRKRAKKVKAKVCIVLDCCRNMLVEGGGKSLVRGSNLPQSSMWAIQDSGMEDDTPRYGGIKISACSLGQQSHSWLFDGTYRGVFTYYFAKGLRGREADKNPADGFVTVKEAFDYAYVNTTRKIQNQFDRSQEPSSTMLESQEFDFILTHWNRPDPTPTLTPIAFPTQPLSGNRVTGGLLGLPEDGVLRVGRHVVNPLALRVLAGPDSPPVPVRRIAEVRWDGGSANPIKTQEEKLVIPPELLTPGEHRLLVLAYTWGNDYVSFEERIPVEHKPYPRLLELRPPEKPLVARLPGRLEAVWGDADGNPLLPGKKHDAVDMEHVETRWRWRKADEDVFTPLKPSEEERSRILSVAGGELPEGSIVFEASLYDKKTDYPIRDAIKTLQLDILPNMPPKIELRSVSGAASAPAPVRRGGGFFGEARATDTEGQVLRVEYALSTASASGETPIEWKNANPHPDTAAAALWKLSDTIPLQAQARGLLRLRAHDDQGMVSPVFEHLFAIEDLPREISRRDASGAIPAYIEPALLLVPAGTHEIGRRGMEGDEQALPPTQMQLEEFYIATTEVSQREFDLFLNSSEGLGFKAGYERRRQRFSFWQNKDTSDLPALGVRWSEAQAYCRWLSSVSGFPYALPTEAQWEAACRHFQRGTNRIQALNPDVKLIHSEKNSLLKYYAQDDLRSRVAKSAEPPKAPVPVGAPTLNPPPQLREGPLFHIFGNAREWCHSSISSGDSRPVARGGAFDSLLIAEFNCFIRVIPANPEEADAWQGFRLIRPPR
jgi:formylglycine-generating enzyme required for sulfatase activity